MAPESTTLTFWHVGGEVIRRGKPVPPADVRQAVVFLSTAADDCLAVSDTKGAIFCASILRQIGDACRAAADHHQCAGPEAARLATSAERVRG